MYPDAPRKLQLKTLIRHKFLKMIFPKTNKEN